MIKENIAKLIKLKSIITLVMVIALVVGWFRQMVTADQFIPLVTMIITFYFAKPDTPKAKEGDANEQTGTNTETN